MALRGYGEVQEALLGPDAGGGDLFEALFEREEEIEAQEAEEGTEEESLGTRHLSDQSRFSYGIANARLRRFLASSHPRFVQDGVIDAQGLHDDIMVFKAFVTSLYNGGAQFSTLCTYRSAFMHLLREANIAPTPAFLSSIRQFYLGLKKASSRPDAANAPRAESKLAMPFTLFCKLAQFCLHSGEEKYAFAHVYMVLTWHLMGHFTSTKELAMDRIRWAGDSLVIYTATPPSDQTERIQPLRDPFHLYANPKRPEICPVLALGLYLMQKGDTCTDGLLFPGSSQDHRFSVVFGELLVECEDIVRSFGIAANQLGPHSLRKGSVSSVMQGSSSGPRIFSIFLRAGWTDGLGLDVTYDTAGDQHVGRTVAGLPTDCADFAVLPPHFAKDDPETTDFVATLIQSHFSPCLLELASLKPVLEFCLASLYYHKPGFLTRTIPVTGSLRSSRLFNGSEEEAEKIKSMIVTGTYRSLHLAATGVPAHVRQLCTLYGMTSRMTMLLDSLPAVMEQLSADATPAEIEAAVKGAMRPLLAEMFTTDPKAPSPRDSSVMESADRPGAAISDGTMEMSLPGPARQESSPDAGTSPAEPCDSSETPANNASLWPAYAWGDGVFRVPPGFKLPPVNVADGWRLWCIGSTAERVPPLRQLKARDLGPNVSDTAFSEWKALYDRCDMFLRGLGRWVPTPSEEQCMQMLALLQPLFDKFHSEAAEGPNGRRKRPARSLRVGSVSRKLRKCVDADVHVAAAAARARLRPGAPGYAPGVVDG